MRFLIDTNLIIKLEPITPSNVEADLGIAADLVRLIAGSEHAFCIHPSSKLELSRDRDEDRRGLRSNLLNKYPVLESPPEPSTALLSQLGVSLENQHDYCDLQLLVAIERDAVDFLVTEDKGIHRWARRLDLEDRVLDIGGAVGVLQSFLDIKVPPEPHVNNVLCHDLNESDPIFDTLREGYDGFDSWLTRCKRESRNAWLIEGREKAHAAVAIRKTEDGTEVGLKGKVLKLSTFKVSEEHGGQKYGELLLRTVFSFATKNDYDWIYLTFYPDKADIAFFVEQFGFLPLEVRNERNELFYAKPMKPELDDVEFPNPLDFHVRYGPHILPQGTPFFLVPIQPSFFEHLFPAAPGQRSLYPTPFGNAIKKAYLCHSKTKLVEPGSILLFYQTKFAKSVLVVGVAERTKKSDDPGTILKFAGKRTVFPFSSIEKMTDGRKVLAILFRQARILKQPIDFRDLVENDALKGPPQSITQVKEEGLEWLRSEIDKRS